MALRKRLFLLSLAAAVPVVLAAAPSAMAAQACSSDVGQPGPQPVGNGYLLGVCLTVPDTGGVITDPTPTITANPNFSGGDGTGPPRIQRMIFTLTGQGDSENDLFTDFTRDGNGNFTLVFPRNVYDSTPTAVFAVSARMTGSGGTGQLVSLTLSFTGNRAPLVATSVQKDGGRAPAARRPYVVAVTGDGAGGESGALRVLRLIRSWNPNLFLYAGDVYNVGTQAEYWNHYGIPGRLWGTLRDRTIPTIGNHDSFYKPYGSQDGFGYFSYFFAKQGTPQNHRFPVSAWRGWHIVSLDSTRAYLSPDGGNAAANSQLAFLRSSLDNNRTGCSLVMYHHPRFSRGPEPFNGDDVSRLGPIWQALANRGVDIVVNGHDHNYQHFRRLNSGGSPRRNGTAEFVVGSGGHGIAQTNRSDGRALKVVDAEGTFGALRLVLNRRGAEFRYVTVDGRVRDAGIIPCSDARPTTRDRTRPTRPPHLRAHGRPGSILLRWYASTDVEGVGVKKYRIYRNGRLIGTTKIQEFVDRNARPGRLHRYYVKAIDWPGNVSFRSNRDSARVQ
jgi:calcineurin-like phosphoesterase family protein